ncbi:nucleotidyl transferase AbiEii/AbiGii toxin family protein [Hyphococcus flavus]|uniref:Nucleotidyl transferase AbiEii/AbiGii toxin family protein n=2 Tax=Parvularculaceae TaxID=255474 RepID=A0AAE9ZEZ5_9PROT|nr:nucleotidyl transferase AbiEii/AbiGii toxin family protein [Hyphococcus flavus]WDI31942.1 nucleotidyl transferase AbiEii/AbiGii toxin family protein [Hyphococcus flavus]
MSLTMARDAYLAQVRLLMRLLPVVSTEPAFALKGGTAINLFYRDMPRLSVDIDLAYLPIENRATSLHAIDAAFDRFMAQINKLPGVNAQRIAGGGDGDTRVLATADGVTVKIETSPVMRGAIGEPRLMRTTDAVEDAFGFVATNVLAFDDLYAGKLHAALDRQHPRDLFDIKLLYENEGLTDDLFRVFLVYAACSSRPMHELLAPNEKDIAEDFAREFAGMTVEPVNIDALFSAGKRLIGDIQARLNGNAAEFLRTLQAGEPDFTLIGLPQAADLPAIKWKLLNLKKLMADNPDKHRAQSEALNAIIRN